MGREMAALASSSWKTRTGTPTSVPRSRWPRPWSRESRRPTSRRLRRRRMTDRARRPRSPCSPHPPPRPAHAGGVRACRLAGSQRRDGRRPAHPAARSGVDPRPRAAYLVPIAHEFADHARPRTAGSVESSTTGRATRLPAAPPGTSAAEIHRLQRVAGNRAVAALLAPTPPDSAPRVQRNIGFEFENPRSTSARSPERRTRPRPAGLGR